MKPTEEKTNSTFGQIKRFFIRRNLSLRQSMLGWKPLMAVGHF